MARRKTDPLPKYQCDGVGETADGKPLESERCPNMVAQTRPSKTGRHYCKKRICQNVRVKSYQQEKDAPSVRQKRIWELMFVHDVSVKTRIECPSCHLEDAIPGWSHRDRSGAPCRTLVGENLTGRGVSVDILDAAWPARVYADGSVL